KNSGPFGKLIASEIREISQIRIQLRRRSLRIEGIEPDKLPGAASLGFKDNIIYIANHIIRAVEKHSLSTQCSKRVRFLNVLWHAWHFPSSFQRSKLESILIADEQVQGDDASEPLQVLGILQVPQDLDRLGLIERSAELLETVYYIHEN